MKLYKVLRLINRVRFQFLDTIRSYIQFWIVNVAILALLIQWWHLPPSPPLEHLDLPLTDTDRRGKPVYLEREIKTLTCDGNTFCHFILSLWLMLLKNLGGRHKEKKLNKGSLEWWTLKITGWIKGLTDKTRITNEMSPLSESMLKRF